MEVAEITSDETSPLGFLGAMLMLSLFLGGVVLGLNWLFETLVG